MFGLVETSSLELRNQQIRGASVYRYVVIRVLLWLKIEMHDGKYMNPKIEMRITSCCKQMYSALENYMSTQ